MGILGVIEAVAGFGKSIMDGVNAWRQRQHDQNIEDKGRKLNAAEGLAATVKGAEDAKRITEDVHDLSDADLDSELRGGTQGNPGADRK